MWVSLALDPPYVISLLATFIIHHSSFIIPTSRHDLVVVLVAIAMLALGAMTMANLMLVERQAAELGVRQAQARMSAESGVEMARLFWPKTLIRRSRPVGTTTTQRVSGVSRSTRSPGQDSRDR